MPAVSRRDMLGCAGAAIVGIAGCIEGETDGPQERTYRLTLTRSGETIEGTVEPAGPVSDVVQITVGDSVALVVQNDADIPLGVHNHANDAEVIVDPGTVSDLSFEATEPMTGRQEVEAWDAEGDAAESEGHGADASIVLYIEVRPEGS